MCCQLFCYPQVQFHGYGFRHVCGTSCRCITSPLVTAFALFRAHAAVITPFHCITVDILLLSILDVKCATLLLSCVLPPPLCIIVIVFNFFSFLSRHHFCVSSFFLERSGRKMLPSDVMKGGDFFTVACCVLHILHLLYYCSHAIYYFMML